VSDTIPTHRSEQTGNPAIDRIQNGVRALITALRLIPFLWGGKHVTGIVFAAGVAQVVRHGLGHRANGYIITRSYGSNVAIRFGESGATTADPANEISLVTTLASTFDVWFY
jgi:hypothetical protein